MILSKGSLAVFWSNGLVGTLATLALLLLLWPVIAAALRPLWPRRTSHVIP